MLIESENRIVRCGDQLEDVYFGASKIISTFKDRSALNAKMSTKTFNRLIYLRDGEGRYLISFRDSIKSICGVEIVIDDEVGRKIFFEDIRGQNESRVTSQRGR